MTFYFSSFFIHVIQAVPHTKYRRAKNLQNDINEKGLYNILSSEKLEPKQIADLYTSRTSSEIQYKIIKTELGYGQVRIHYTTSLYAKFALGFIATIIRYQFQCYARGISRNTSDIIRELNLISAIKINDVYTHSHTENERQLNFFNFFDCDESLIDESGIKAHTGSV